MSPSLNASEMVEIADDRLENGYHQIDSLHVGPSSTLQSRFATPSSEPLDLICIGFGPASIAIATALAESTDSSTYRPKALFLERQPKFAWHSGMQLPGAKMQISFLKDMATPRNPQSKFTFLSYLFERGRLNDFINLSTFTPSRLEYEDYLRWCAGKFEARGQVAYGMEVVDVSPVESTGGKVGSFVVKTRNTISGEVLERETRHVVVAVGGRGYIPREFPQGHSKVIHSSQYSMRVASALPNPRARYNIAVVGNGQSAAEIFNDIPSRYPNAKVTLVIRGAALRPSDDSPFVNEVFNPDRVDSIFKQNCADRTQGITADRATNYGVVRIDLLEHLYEQLYLQRLKTPNEKEWKIRIQTNRRVVEARESRDGKLVLSLEKVTDDGSGSKAGEEIAFDAVIVATGYLRNTHEEMLRKTRHLLPANSQDEKTRIPVARDYRVGFDETKVAANAGVWLQGCNESTHGLSDTLLSILAIRGGELVQSIFGDDIETAGFRARL